MITEKLTPREFEGQFGCLTEGKCPRQHPQDNGDYGCTFWWEDDQTNKLTGEKRIAQGCVGAILKHTLDLLIDKQIEEVAAVEGLAEAAVNRIGVVFANNMHKLPLADMQQALKHSGKQDKVVIPPQ